MQLLPNDVLPGHFLAFLPLLLFFFCFFFGATASANPAAASPPQKTNTTPPPPLLCSLNPDYPRSHLVVSGGGQYDGSTVSYISRIGIPERPIVTPLLINGGDNILEATLKSKQLFGEFWQFPAKVAMVPDDRNGLFQVYFRSGGLEGDSGTAGAFQVVVGVGVGCTKNLGGGAELRPVHGRFCARASGGTTAKEKEIIGLYIKTTAYDECENTPPPPFPPSPPPNFQ